MKKKYMQPSIEVVNVSTTQMICESLRTFGPTDAVTEKAGKRRYADDEDDLFDSADIW